jgi:serine/threonine protein kinase
MTGTATGQQGASKNQPSRNAGDVLGARFQLHELLGRGGFGEVWRASELLPDGTAVRQVALKLLGLVPGADWAREAKVLASLRHPSLVTVYSAGILETPDPVPFVAMELLDGKTLSKVSEERRRIPWRRALDWMTEVALALDHIHERGIVHLDLKPANLLLVEDQVRVLDFGIAQSGEDTSAPVFAGRVEPVTVDESPGKSPPQNLGAAPSPPTAGTPRPRPAPGPQTAASLGTAALLALEATDTDEGRSPTIPLRKAGLIVGTPGYMAPEIYEGKPPTPAADAYALGACLFELLTGVLPQKIAPTVPHAVDAASFLALSADLRRATVQGDLATLEELDEHLPRGLVELVTQLLALDPTKRVPRGTLGSVLAATRERPFGVPEPPYRGLRAYGREAEGSLFGRSEDASRLSHELAETPFLVLQGASGSGKSSLAVAGVVPCLARRFADGMDDWIAVVVRPYVNIEAAVRRARTGLGDLAPFVGIVVVVDQLEELVTQREPADQDRFAEELSAFVQDADRGIRVLATLREDFTTRVAARDSLASRLPDAVRFVPPPSAGSVRDIVVTPLALAGVTLDDERPVVEDVLRELRAGEGRLPLISFALTEWYETRVDQRLTADGWRSIGGVAGALTRHADAILAALPASSVAVARDLFLRLVTPEGTRARALESELSALSPLHGAVLDAFLRARLLTVEDSAVSISHEALLATWPVLHEWMEGERADRTEASALSASAKAYERAPAAEKHELLLTGLRLDRAKDLVKRRPDLSAPYLSIVKLSASRSLRDRLTRNGALLLVLGAAVGAGVYYSDERRLNEEYEKKLRDNMVQLQGQYAQKAEAERKANEAAAALGKESASQREKLVSCQTTLIRQEREHRAALANRYPLDTLDHRVITFLIQWEHAWNLHDSGTIGSFYAPEVDWVKGGLMSREDQVTVLDNQWKHSPNARMLIGEATVSKSADHVVVRLTRDLRIDGESELAVLRLEVSGDKPGDFQITSGKVEKVVATGKIAGCK